MNWLTIIVIIILGVSMVGGYRKGFVRLVVSFASVLLTLIIVTAITPYIGEAIKTQTGLYDMIQESCVKGLKSSGQENTQIKEETLLESEKLPDVVKYALAAGGNEYTGNILEGIGAYDYIGDFVANMVIHIIAFIVAFLVITIIFRVTILSLGFVNKIPVINGINKVAGGLVGLLQGLIVIWIGFLVIFLCSGTSLGKDLIAQINQSIILNFFYDNNLLLQLITSFLK